MPVVVVMVRAATEAAAAVQKGDYLAVQVAAAVRATVALAVEAVVATVTAAMAVTAVAVKATVASVAVSEATMAMAMVALVAAVVLAMATLVLAAVWAAGGRTSCRSPRNPCQRCSRRRAHWLRHRRSNRRNPTCRRRTRWSTGTQMPWVAETALVAL